ncbi:arginine ABC transporter permease ArtM [Parasalinivibrio latis]
MQDYFPTLAHGLVTSLSLTFCALVVGFMLAIGLTVVRTLKTPGLNMLARGFLVLFTGTPLLVQIFLIYYGPGQFAFIKESVLWTLFAKPWFCAMLALALNSAAYATLLFNGAMRAIPQGQWEACAALGMSKYQTLSILLPYALKRALPSYSNEVVLVFKGSSLASTITIMDIMGYAQRLNAQTYDTLAVFGAAGIIYLSINALLSLGMRGLEKKLLKFEQPA